MHLWLLPDDCTKVDCWGCIYTVPVALWVITFCSKLTVLGVFVGTVLVDQSDVKGML